MMNPVNIVQPFKTIVFADSYMAQPVFETLLQGGWVAGLCTSRRKQPGANLRHLARLTNVPVIETNRSDLTDNLKSWLTELKPDVLLTISYPYKLPLEILRIPKIGAFNVHSGKLPDYRGPQPSFWEILNCEKEGAVTVHFMDEEYDRGAVIASQPVPIAPEDTYGLHSVRLAFAAVNIVEFLFGAIIQYGANIPALEQDQSKAIFHERPILQDLVINWEEYSGKKIRALVKACNPWNQGAFTSIKGINVRLTDVALVPDAGNLQSPPGIILISEEKRVLVNCKDGSALQLDVISMDEGILPGYALFSFGMQAGDKFDTLKH